MKASVRYARIVQIGCAPRWASICARALPPNAAELGCLGGTEMSRRTLGSQRLASARDDLDCWSFAIVRCQ